jgi:hypothetical protein
VDRLPEHASSFGKAEVMFGSFKAAKRLALAAAAPRSRPAATELRGSAPKMAMPAERARTLADLQAAFKGVGKVGVGPLPGTTAKQDVTPDISYGPCAFSQATLVDWSCGWGQARPGQARPTIMASGPRSTGSRRTSPGGRW